MRLDKFILLPGYSAERILISAAIEQIAGSACIANFANNSNLVPSYFSTPRARERVDSGNEVETTPTNANAFSKTLFFFV